jgi:hypothetical protein
MGPPEVNPQEPVYNTPPVLQQLQAPPALLLMYTLPLEVMNL